MASTTLLTLIQECGIAAHWRLADACSAAGTTSTAILNAADSPLDELDPDTLYRGCWAMVEADSAGTPLNVGAVRRVKSYTPSTGTITLATGRTWTDATTTTQTVGLYKTVPPDAGGGTGEQETWKQYINRVLRGVRYRRYSLLTLAADGDMEATGTTSWTASSSTLTKTTTASLVAFGKQSMRVANSSANGYARSTLVPVAANDEYVVRADCNVDSGTAVLEAYDETNGASINSESTTLRDWRALSYRFTIPSGCHSLSIRLKGTEATADVYWDNVMLRAGAARRMDAPSWLVEEQQVEALVEWWPGSSQSDAHMLASQTEGMLRHFDLVSDPLGGTAWRVEFRFVPRQESLLFLRGLAPYDELSAITDTTTADKDMVVTGACLLAALRLEDKEMVARFGPLWQARQAGLPRRAILLPGLWLAAPYTRLTTRGIL